MGFWPIDDATWGPENDGAMGGIGGDQSVTSDWENIWDNYELPFDHFETYEPNPDWWWNEKAANVAYQVVAEGINGFLSLMGVVTNIITIVVFVKMGYKESSNITMSAIAFWELLKSLFILYVIVDPYIGLDNVSLVAGYLHKIQRIALHTSGMLAAYVAIERCLCVSKPFTSRFLLTPKTASVMCFAISIVIFGIFSVDIIYDHKSSIDRYLAIVNIICPIVTLTITSVCTIIIVYHLKKSSKFRSENKKGGSKQMSTREKKTTKMLVIIIFFYILYLIPFIAYLGTYKLLEYDNYWTEAKIAGMESVFRYLVLLVSLVNSCVNLFIFYFMSSAFKLTFRKIFHLPL